MESLRVDIGLLSKLEVSKDESYILPESSSLFSGQDDGRSLNSSKKTLQGITKVRCRTGLKKVMELKYLKMEISTKVNGIKI